MITAPTTASTKASTTTGPPPTTPASASSVPASSVPASSAPVTVPRDFSAIGPIVQAFVDERSLNGAGFVVVDRDDGIVYEDYWGEFGPDRVSLFASSSKSIVAGVLLRLADQGLLDLDAPIADAVDWGTANPTVTTAQLLSSTSGLVGLGPNPAYRPYLCQFLVGGDLQTCGSSIFTTTDDDADIVAPDTEFRYGGGQWQVAGALAEAVSGKSWAQILEETYVEPCGVDSLGFTNQWTQFGSIGFGYPRAFDADPAALQPTDNPNMEGGGYSTARDYATLLLMQLRDGRCGANQVLSAESNARLHADRIGTLATPLSSGQPDRSGYGLGWWVDPLPGGIVTDAGAYGSVPWLDLADGYGAYLVIEADAFTGGALADRLFVPLDDAMNAER